MLYKAVKSSLVKQLCRFSICSYGAGCKANRKERVGSVALPCVAVACRSFQAHWIFFVIEAHGVARCGVTSMLMVLIALVLHSSYLVPLMKQSSESCWGGVVSLISGLRNVYSTFYPKLTACHDTGAVGRELLLERS